MTESSLIQILQKTIESQNETIESLRKELQRSNENLEYLLKKLYGKKSEKTAVIDGQLVIGEIALGLFNEAEVNADLTVLEPVPFEEPVKRTRSGYKRKEIFKNLPQQDHVYKLDESQRTCPACEADLSDAGKKFLRSEIKYIPAEISIVNIYQETYECRKCKKEGRPSIINPYTPEPVLQHSYATASSVAWTMYQKFVQAVPLYRQEKDWKQMGFPITRATLSNWILKTSEEWLTPVVERLHQELLSEKYLHADETPVQVLNEPGKKNTSKSYMWVYTTSKEAKNPVRIFQYETGRSGDHAKEFLKGFDGYLHTDAYSGYGKVKDIKHCLCWAHVRRYFVDASPKDMKSPEATLPATGIAYCNQLFDWERKFKDLSPEQRKEQRLKHEKPVLEAFWSWAEKEKEQVLPKSKIGTALQYAVNVNEFLSHVLMNFYTTCANEKVSHVIMNF
ncbi:IS66 family transposase [Alkaliphilus hydrothermalis]|uniref:Transposase n=1 Tax=Alkaliphilus hydrothermalis TaxID=1482730 RepID=A0ABS2NQG3_9FIRM|nr:IS66 family transposase [Alkaliphilus hydrothermalis]MBM7615154.1 transposase [Alkaliphilus hydrothermalis]